MIRNSNRIIIGALAMIAAVFRLITIKIQHEAKSKKTQRATHILISMIVAAACK
jgi:hypothetical protein